MIEILNYVSIVDASEQLLLLLSQSKTIPKQVYLDIHPHVPVVSHSHIWELGITHICKIEKKQR